MITKARFLELLDVVRAAGFGGDVDWSENVTAPANAAAFAREAIFVICNSGMHHRVAQTIFAKVMAALHDGRHPKAGLKHPGKACAIDSIWAHRDDLYLDWLIRGTIEEQLDFCESLPWIGKITKYHLAKNFGADVAKPDVHLERLARHEGTTPQLLCERLARETGFRIATVDVVLWRACAIGAIRSRELPVSL